MAWITPIFDRTNADFQSDVAQIAAWRADPETAVFSDLKTCLNVVDMNRIEGNMQFLEDSLIAMGNAVSITTKTNWVRSDKIILQNGVRDDISRLITNATQLRSVVPPQIIIEAPPTKLSHYEDVNTLEKTLFDIYNYIQNVYDGYRYSGTVISGDW